ncbi:MAG: undecaprenyl/decaprenyl-phosphate alpha-N-acetylglucosaminyl 1-phosphate transferase [Acidimicrobiia bacterium]|nr:undecaprenyl/decaprenyl-phosphate alpha-N-acetylglucosaminyl 1-phosphate transferase [Acidimicrobiia bacterium]
MQPGMLSYVVVFAVAAVVTALTVPVVRRMAVRIGAVVKPDDRRVHEVPTPTLGGAGMIAGVVVALAVAGLMTDFDEVFETPSEILGVLMAAVLIFAIGAYDDVRDVSAPAKTAGMILAGSVLSFAGVGLLILRVPLLDVFILSSDWSALLTVVWVLGMANAINLIDGLDGLAAGIVAIASFAFFLYSVELGNEGVLQPGNLGALIAIVTVGVCVGFLPYNLHPARIFMGDGGSLLLGLLLAASTMAVGGRTSQPFPGQTYFFFAPIFIPLFVLAVPIVDVLFAIVRRASSGANLTTPDKGHLHHRLMSLGHGQRRSVAILWLWTALMSAFVLYPTYTGQGQLFAVFAIFALALAVYTMFHPVARRARADNVARRANGDDEPGPENLDSTDVDFGPAGPPGDRRADGEKRAGSR